MKKPNVIFILIDDMGWRDLSCYGSDFYETPNIDKLAKDGVIFTQAYSSCPVCSPARASFLTGKYPARLGLTNYIGGHEEGKLICPPYIDHLDPKEYNLAKAMKKNGYKTFHVGKWHLGGEEFYPEKQGFDVNIGGCEMGCPNTYFSPYRNPKLPDIKDGEYLEDRLTDEAIKLITNTEEPFFMFLSHYTVHHPFQAKEDDIRRFEDKAKRLHRYKINPFVENENFPCNHKRHMKVTRRYVQSDPVYAAMIYNLDVNTGRLVETLKQKGIFEDTIIIFTSDNGGLSTSEGSPTTNAPLSEGKGWMYDGGIREPLIIHYPNKVKHSICDTPVIMNDFYPTILSMTECPLEVEQHVDGIDISPLLNGGRLEERPLFWHYPHYGNQGGTPTAAVRLGDFKLIKFFEDSHTELYNIKNDISELYDLTDTNSHISEKLDNILTNWLIQINASMPQKNINYME